MTETKKLKIKLSGSEGNAFSIIGKCSRAARREKWSEAKISKFIDEAKAGDYDNAIQTAMKYFDVR